MTRGPDQQRLLNYVTPAQREDLHTAHDQWRKGSELLTRLAVELRNKASQIRLSNERVFQGETATTAAQAFDDTAVTMDKKSKDMSDGSVAFALASDAIHAARVTSTHLEQHGPGSFPKDPGIPPGSSQPEDVQAQSAYDTAVSNYWQTYHANEQAARDAIAKLQDNHTEQAQVFQRIHGEVQQPSGPTGGGGNPVRQGTPATPTHVPHGDPTDTRVPHVITDQNHVIQPTDPHIDDPTGHDPGFPTHRTPTPTDPGIPQGPGTHTGTTLPTGPTAAGPLGGVGGMGTVGGGAGAMGGIGAVAGGALGGAAAAGLAAGGLNGGLNGLMPVGGAGGRGGLSASGVRGIGATSRTGVGSVLGRGTGTTGRAGAGGMAGRNSGRNGTRGTGSSRGSRGRAGGRGAGAGAGSGRNGKDKKRQGEDRDLFDDGSDWIDDEDVAPGLLD